MIIGGSIILLLLLYGVFIMAKDAFYEAEEETARNWKKADPYVYYFQFFIEFWIAFVPRLFNALIALFWIGVLIAIIYWIFFS